MASGYNKNPQDGYEPNISWSGRLLLLAIIAVVVIGSLGWLLT